MKKFRIPALVLAILMVTALFCGCKEVKTPEQIYEDAMRKTLELKQVHSNGTLSVSIDTSLGIATDTGLSFETWIDTTEAENPYTKASIVLNYAAMGMKIKASVCFSDGYVFIEAMGQKQKIKIDEEMKDMSEGISAEDYPQYIKSITREDSGSDETVLKIQFDTKAYLTYVISENEEIQKFIEEIKDEIGGDPEKMPEIDIDDTEITCHVDKNGYISKSEIVLSIKIHDEENSLEINISGNIETDSPGKFFEVTRPDPEEYTDIDTDFGDMGDIIM